MKHRDGRQFHRLHVHSTSHGFGTSEKLFTVGLSYLYVAHEHTSNILQQSSLPTTHPQPTQPQTLLERQLNSSLTHRAPTSMCEYMWTSILCTDCGSEHATKFNPHVPPIVCSSARRRGVSFQDCPIVTTSWEITRSGRCRPCIAEIRRRQQR